MECLDRFVVTVTDQIWHALIMQCSSTKDVSKVKTLVVVRRKDILAVVKQLGLEKKDDAV